MMAHAHNKTLKDTPAIGVSDFKKLRNSNHPFSLKLAILPPNKVSEKNQKCICGKQEHMGT